MIYLVLFVVVYEFATGLMRRSAADVMHLAVCMAERY